jgi:tetratricopeptide (TPR) repeat protein
MLEQILKSNGCMCKKGKQGAMCGECMLQNPDLVARLSFDIVYEPPRVPDDYGVEEKDIILYEKARKEPQQTSNFQEMIDILEPLSKKYPLVPQISYNLAVAYQSNSNTTKCTELLDCIVKNNPDYILARVLKGQLFLANDQPEKFAELFDNKFHIKLLYPEYNEFYVQDVIMFFGVIAEYFFYLNNIERAENYLKILMKLDPEHPYTIHLQEKYLISIFEKIVIENIDFRNQKQENQKKIKTKQKNNVTKKPWYEQNQP